MITYHLEKRPLLNVGAGYSGVAIYTRQSKISPIRAEEGITGRLTPPSSTKPKETYLDLPEALQIGGYPHIDYDDAILLDSEGRAVVLDFGAFVLIGTYCPAGREETERVDFRHGFLSTLEERVRNLDALGRNVVVVGDLNISPQPLDDADAWELTKKMGVDSPEVSKWRETHGKVLLRSLCSPSQGAIVTDIVRHHHPDRIGMYTCKHFVYVE